jgi:hypothetical protein
LAVVPQDQGAFSLSPSLDVEPIVLEKEYNTRDRNDIFEVVMDIKSSIHVGSRRLDAGRPVYSFAKRRRSRSWSLFLRCWTQEPRYANHGCSANRNSRSQLPAVCGFRCVHSHATEAFSGRCSFATIYNRVQQSSSQEERDEHMPGIKTDKDILSIIGCSAHPTSPLH